MNILIEKELKYVANKMINLENLEKLASALDSRMKTKVSIEELRAMAIESELQLAINETRNMLGGKSLVYLTQSEYDVLTDEEKNNDTIMYFITDAEDSSHDHVNKEFLDSLTEELFTQINAEIESLKDTKVDSSEYEGAIGELTSNLNNEIDRATEAEAGLQSNITNISSEIERVEDMLGGKSFVYLTQAEYDLLSEEEKKDSSKVYVVTDATEVTHDHANKEFLDSLTEEYFAEINSEIESLENNKVDVATYNAAMETISGSIETLEEAIDNEVDRAMGVEADLTAALSTKLDISAAVENLIQSAKMDLEGEGFEVHSLYKNNVPISPVVNMISVINTDGIQLPTYLEAYESAINELSAGLGTKADTQHYHEHIYMNDCSNTDFNTIKTAGWYYGYTGMTNAAVTGDISVLEVIVYSPDWVLQRQTMLYGSGITYERCFVMGNTWSEWKLCYDSNNKPSPADLGAAESGHTHDEFAQMDADITSAKNEAISDAVDQAKEYTDTALAALVDSAPDAMNTLNELATAIQNHNTEYEAYVATVSASITTAKNEAIVEAANKDAALHTEITGEINTAVNAEKERAEEVEVNLQSQITALGTSKLDAGYKTTIDELNDAKHEHTNKAFLDSLDEEAYNKLVSDVTALGNSKLDKTYESIINELDAAKHTHSNVEVLNGLTAEKFAAYDSDITGLKSGKLDASYATIISDIDAKKHEHTNKSFLDGLSEETFNAINASITTLTNTKLNVSDYETYAATKQDKTDNTLSTSNKTITGAINELKGAQDSMSADITELEQTKVDKNYVDQKISVVDAISLNGYKLWVGTSEELEGITKDPKTLYFEISDDETQNDSDVVQVDIVNGVLTLTKDKYQKTNMATGTQIVFPEVNGFTELHLYFDTEEDMTLTFPDNCKWRMDPNIESGKSYEIVATYNTIHWLVNVIVYS